MAQNYSLPQNVTGMLDMVDWANTTVGGIYGDLMLFALFVVAYMVFKKFENKQAFASAAWITALTSIFAFISGFATERSVIISIILAAFSMIWLRFENE